MKLLSVSLVIAVLLLLGCGQIPASARSNVASTGAHAARGPGSRMRPGTSSHDLLYVSGTEGNLGYFVHVYTYPEGQLVGDLTSVVGPHGECVDAAGDVFILGKSSLSSSTHTIFEFAHGGTSPIALLNDPGDAFGCGVDPTTGDIAVANVNDDHNPYHRGWGDVAVYRGDRGSPTMYYSKELSDFYLCGYDDMGNLFASGLDYSSQQTLLAQLPRKSESLSLVNVNVKLYADNYLEPQVQWDGRYITVSSIVHGRHKGGGVIVLYRLRISGSNATVIGTTDLAMERYARLGQSWIQGDTALGWVVSPRYWGDIAFWRYPRGGQPTSLLRRAADLRKGGALWGIAVSRVSRR